MTEMLLRLLPMVAGPTVGWLLRRLRIAGEHDGQCRQPTLRPSRRHPAVGNLCFR